MGLWNKSRFLYLTDCQIKHKKTHFNNSNTHTLHLCSYHAYSLNISIHHIPLRQTCTLAADVQTLIQIVQT